jgi:hypothetical protein
MYRRRDGPPARPGPQNRDRRIDSWLHKSREPVDASRSKTTHVPRRPLPLIPAAAQHVPTQGAEAQLDLALLGPLGDRESCVEHESPPYFSTVAHRSHSQSPHFLQTDISVIRHEAHIFCKPTYPSRSPQFVPTLARRNTNRYLAATFAHLIHNAGQRKYCEHRNNPLRACQPLHINVYPHRASFWYALHPIAQRYVGPANSYRIVYLKSSETI